VQLASRDVSPVSARGAFLFWKGEIEVFSVGDKVIYGSHLLCGVDGIQDKEFDNKIRRYYVIKPLLESGSTIYFPVDDDFIAERIRRVLSTEEIYAALKAIPGEEAVWIEDEKEREGRYRQILAVNDRVAILKLVKALCLRKTHGKKFSVSDERVLKDAQKILCEELAYVLDIKRERVFAFILETIEDGTKTSSGS
jgi:CarD family transcriptional regulator